MVKFFNKGSGAGKHDVITTFLCPDTVIEGIIKFAGTIRLDGRVKGDILSSRVRSQLKEYRLKNNQIKQFMEIARFNAPNYVFDKILTLLNNSQINDVILKIGHIRTEMEKDGLTLMLVPVRIKAYVKYGKLKSFFNALNKSTVYTIDKMEIAWSNEKEKDSIEIDMTVILKYKDTGKTLERI